MDTELLDQLMDGKRDYAKYADAELVRMSRELLTLIVQAIFEENGDDRKAEAKQVNRRRELAKEVEARAMAIAAESDGKISNTNLNILEAVQGALKIHNCFFSQQKELWLADSMGKLGNMVGDHASMNYPNSSSLMAFMAMLASLKQ